MPIWFDIYTDNNLVQRYKVTHIWYYYVYIYNV